MSEVSEVTLDRKYINKVTTSSFIGNTLEYYDFLVYGTAAALIFPKVFFPADADPFVATLASFGTFAVGFLFRPVGGMFFGNLGDKVGRKAVLIITLVTMGISTFLIGVLPSYATAGLWAPALLIVLRCLQGFAVGGEWGGSMIIVLESVPQNKRAWYTCWPNTGGFSAQILVTGLLTLLGVFGNISEHPWLWRIPFLISLVIVAVGLWFRRALEETPIFTDMIAKAEAAHGEDVAAERGLVTAAAAPAAGPLTLADRYPIIRVFKEDWRSLLLIVGLRFGEAVPYFLLTVFVLSYGPAHVGIARQDLLNVILIISFLAFPAHGLFAWLSDRYGRKPIYLWGSIVGAVMAFPFMMMVQTGNFWLILLGYVLVLNVGHNAINAVQPTFFTELFSADRRYSGAAAGREIASILAGGLTPFIATALAGPNGANWQWVAGYVMVGGVISIVATVVAPETFKRDLHAAAAPPNELRTVT